MPAVLDARVVTGTGGGPEKTILNSPRFLARRGYRMLCAYLHPPGDPGFLDLRERARRLEAPLVSIPDRGAWDVSVLGSLLRVCREERVVVWHGHDYKSNLIGLLLRPFWPMRLVTTVHGWVRFTKRTRLYYAIDRFCLARYEKVICVSDDLHERCLAAGVPAGACLVLENAIDTEDYTRRVPVAEAKRRLGVPADRLLVGAVGRLSPEKGFDVLIRAVDELRRRGLDLELWIAGDGDHEHALARLVAELGQADRVRLLGYRNDVREILEAVDVFALSSIREGLPNVLLEAMALEVPVVATRIAGIPRLIADGQDGLLVAPGSEGELAHSLAKLLADPQLRAGIASAARRTIEARYSFASRMAKLAALYDAMLSGGH